MTGKDSSEIMKDNLKCENGESSEIMRFNSMKSMIWKIKIKNKIIK